MTDIEILEMRLGGMVVKEMTAITFFGWMATRLNNVTITNNPTLGELRTAISMPVMSPRVSDDTKVRYIRKLIELNIPLS